MYPYTDLPILPTQVIGSYSTPGWLYVVRDAVKAGQMGSFDVRGLTFGAVKG